MEEICSTHRKMLNVLVHILTGTYEGKRLLWIHRLELEDNIEMELTDMVYVIMD
jgi:hypothetical protein